MNAAIRLAAAICSAGAIALCAAFFLLHMTHTEAPPAQHVPLSAPRTVTAAPTSTLFPELSSAHITALCVSTPERSFLFRRDKQGLVSVNGQQADSEIFSTLLDQIAELPVEHHSAFSPQPQNLMLTLVISSDEKQQTARFYEDDASGETAHIVLDAGESSEYRQTNSWRIGTMMMTCEGTRILDIHGNETPAVSAAKPD